VGWWGLGRWSCAALCGALLLSGCNWIDARGAKGPSVLLVTIDTLRADRVGVYGLPDAATPTLDRLAASGVLFEQAIAAVPLTLPSHASILTGQYPPTHGVRHNAIFRLSSEAETLAERFQASGVDTGAVVGAAVLDPAFGLDQGFDVYDAKLPQERSAAAGFFERSAQGVTDAALSWLRRTDGRFFLWVHYYDVHGTYNPPEPFKTRFAKRPYDGEVAYVDQELGRLLQGLEQSGRRVNTLVAVTADHGEGLGEHGEASHSYLIYDSVLHVPLLLAGPGVPAGRRVPTVVSTTGLAATLLHLAGLPALAKTDVGDLTPLFRDAATGSQQQGLAGGAPADSSGWAYAESLAGELDHGWAPIQAIRSDGFHYIRAPRPELFARATDPAQRDNLLPKEQSERGGAVALAEQRISALLASGSELSPVAVDAETRAQIEALGYVVPKGAVVTNGADPKDVHRLADLWYEALALLFTKKYEEAERVAQGGLAKMPQSSQLQDVLARVYLETGRPGQALPYALEASRLNPEWADYQAQVAYTYLVLRDLPHAFTAFERASELDPKHPGAHVGLMWRMKLGGSLEETEEHARQALANSGERAVVFEQVGEVWEHLGDYERALSVFREGAERFPEHVQLHMRLAIQYARLGDEGRAEQERAAAGEAARDVNLRNRLAIVYAARRDFAHAEPIFRDILLERPQEPSTRRLLARMLRETGRETEAEELARGVSPAAEILPPKPPTEIQPRG
jgi:arylsulfatase A-like enzyme/Flp pilus assembly protein TadD